MRLTDVVEILEAVRAPADYYVVGTRDEATCLFTEDDRYVVCTFDRDKRVGARHFDIEDDACRYFLRQLIDDKWNFRPARLL